jgi:hypothetical protein
VSRLEGLPPDLHAVLSLLLRQRRTYAEIAGMLHIEEHAVHDRAHAALVMLAPRQARELTTAAREQIGEYLLGQSGEAGQRETQATLAGSTPARAWAQALAAELAPLATEPLPGIPTGEAVPEPEPPAATPVAAPTATAASTRAASSSPTTATSSSRMGGMIVLGVIAAVVIAAVVLIVGVGGGSGGGSHPSSTAGAHSSAATSSTASTTTAAAGEPRVDATLPLTPPNPAGKTLGVVEVISRGSLLAFLVVAEHLPPTTGFRYAAWLYNSPTDALLLGSGPKVGSDGILKAAGALPANASHYSKIILTEEHSEKPSRPGPTVLGGPFKTG